MEQIWQDWRGRDTDPDDVVMLAKQYMHSRALSQEPLLVLPKGVWDENMEQRQHLRMMTEILPTGILPTTDGRNQWTETTIKEYRKTASLILKDPWKLDKAWVALS